MKQITFCLALTSTLGIFMPESALAESYIFEGPDFTHIEYSNFSYTDSLTGTMTINNPPISGSCTGLGSGAGQCDITGLTLTASGLVPLTLDLITADIDFSGGPDSSFSSHWFLTFDETGDIDHWGLRLHRVSTGEILITGSEVFSIAADFSTYADRAGYSPFGIGGTTTANPGYWTLVPEPTSAAIFLLALLCGTGTLRRRGA
jgi:hypothetical protein